MKVGIIRCQEQSNNCAGYQCLPAVQELSGEFSRYESVELVGFDTCGGCNRGLSNKIVDRALRLKKKGAQVIHLGSCLVACPFKEIYLEALKEKVNIPIVEFTHWHPPLPTGENANLPVIKIEYPHKKDK